MDDLCIPILTDTSVSKCFVKANLWLTKLYDTKFVDGSDVRNKKILQELWLKEFNAELLYDDYIRSFSKIKFNTLQDKTLFLIKWG